MTMSHGASHISNKHLNSLVGQRVEYHHYDTWNDVSTGTILEVDFSSPYAARIRIEPDNPYHVTRWRTVEDITGYIVDPVPAVMPYDRVQVISDKAGTVEWVSVIMTMNDYAIVTIDECEPFRVRFDEIMTPAYVWEVAQ